jgi:hypothetical protein
MALYGRSVLRLVSNETSAAAVRYCGNNLAAPPKWIAVWVIISGMYIFGADKVLRLARERLAPAPPGSLLQMTKAVIFQVEHSVDKKRGYSINFFYKKLRGNSLDWNSA